LLRTADVPITIYATIMTWELTADADGDYYTYTAWLDWPYGGRSGQLPEGTAVVGFRTPSPTERYGVMRMEPGDPGWGPRLVGVTLGDWEEDGGDGWWDQRQVVWMGNLQGSATGFNREFGFMAGVHLQDTSEAYMVASNRRFELHGPDATWSNTDGKYITIGDAGIGLGSVTDTIANTYASTDNAVISRKISFYDDLDTQDYLIGEIYCRSSEIIPHGASVPSGDYINSLVLYSGSTSNNDYWNKIELTASGLNEAKIELWGGRSPGVNSISLGARDIRSAAQRQYSVSAETITFDAALGKLALELIFGNLPTSDPSNRGQIYIDSATGNLKVSGY
jgi:hypothetical protein